MKPSNFKLFLFGSLAAGLLPIQNAAALTVTSIMSGTALSVQWLDSAGSTRVAIMVNQSANGPGYLSQLTYQVNGSSRVCTGSDFTSYPGDGFVQNHTAAYGDYNSHDQSTPGTTTVVLSGSSHVIIEYDMPTYQIAGETIPTSIQWFFADGRDHPIFALSQDARTTDPSGNLGADTRSPYGSMNFDGVNNDDDSSDMGGASYGDTYKFVTLAADPEIVTGDSGWSDNTANTIPYAMEWACSAEVDAEMGHVATVPITVQDQGADRDANTTYDPRDNEELNGPMIPYGANDDGPDAWAFQLLDYILHPDYQGDQEGASDGVQIYYSKLSWGGNFGKIGGYNNGDNALDDTQYSEHYDSSSDILTGTRVNGMLMAYSVFVVLGTHNNNYLTGAVGTQVTQMENVAQATLSATTGSVVTTGPAGVGNAANATITYSPAGYNPTYSAWEITASANAVTATLTPTVNKPLANPVFIIDNYTLSGLPSAISINGSTASSGYYASVDTVNQRLWITVNVSSITSVSPLTLVVGELPAPTITSFTPSTGTVGTSVTITGTHFKSTTAPTYTASVVTFNGVSATIGTISATSITTTVPAGATTGPITVTTPGGTATSTGSSTPTFIPTYTLSVIAEPLAGDGMVKAGGITGGGSLAGGPQTLTATANPGFIFTNWTSTPAGTQLSTSPNYNITLTANTTYYANFLTAYTLMVTTNPVAGGSVTGGGIFAAGSTQTITATPNGGYEFTDWTVGATAGSTSPGTNFTLNASVTLNANFALTPPQIVVLDDSGVVANNQTVNFGDPQPGPTGVTLAFSVTNAGGSNLDLGISGSLPSGYTVTQSPPGSLAYGAQGMFSVMLNTTTIGSYSGNITLTNNDPNNGTFVIAVTGNVVSPTPQLTVLRGATVITNGQTNAVSFGNVLQNQPGPIVTFTVTNWGEQTLDLGTPTVPLGYTLVTNPPVTIAGGSSGSFSVQLDSILAGTNSGDITFTNNSNDTNGIFSFPITGVVNSEIISLTGNLAFGGVALAASSNQTLTISNGGDLPLTVSNISYPTGYSGSTLLAAPIMPGASTNVTVTFSPIIASNYSGLVTIVSDATSGMNTIPISGFGANGTLVLTIDVSGEGTVSPSLSGQTFNAGTKHTIKAIPTVGSGYIFAGWSGSTNSIKNPLTFTMETSTVLEASFVTNPFPQFVGTYNGLFVDANGIVAEETAGMLKGLTVNQKGGYNGTLLINGASHPISGTFDANCQASNSITRPAAQGDLEVALTLITNNPAPQVTGTVSVTNQGIAWTANLTADRATNSLISAEFTMLILPVTSNAPPTNSPGGDGYALITNYSGTLKNPASATARITGDLADGTAFNQTVPVSEDGYIPLYANLYSGKGLILGWINLELANPGRMSPTWIHPATRSGLYTPGFTNVLSSDQILLSRWPGFAGNFPSLINLSEHATIYDTNILTNVVVSVTDFKVEAGKLASGTIAAHTGLLTVTIGTGAAKVTGHGAVLYNSTTPNGGGYFLTKTNAQAIILSQ